MLLEGVRYVRSQPKMILILVMVFFAGTFGMNFQITSALMATQVFDKGASEYGLLGSVHGGRLAGRRPDGRPPVDDPGPAAGGRRALGFGVAEIAAGLMPSYLAFALMCPVIGFCTLTLLNSANATMQLESDPGDPRAGDGALHDDRDGRHADRGADHRLGRGDLGARWTLIMGGVLVIVGAGWRAPCCCAAGPTRLPARVERFDRGAAPSNLFPRVWRQPGRCACA